MKFKYKKLAPKLIRPIINFEVFTEDGSKSTKYTSLVDSGADLNIFDAEIAGLLGLDLKSGIKQEVGGITSGAPEPIYIHPVILDIGGVKYKTFAGFKEGLQNGYGVLGQQGFFDKFKVVFDFQNEEVELKERR